MYCDDLSDEEYNLVHQTQQSSSHVAGWDELNANWDFVGHLKLSQDHEFCLLNHMLIVLRSDISISW